MKQLYLILNKDEHGIDDCNPLFTDVLSKVLQFHHDDDYFIFTYPQHQRVLSIDTQYTVTLKE